MRNRGGGRVASAHGLVWQTLRTYVHAWSRERDE
jgi:hypothetical protein